MTEQDKEHTRILFAGFAMLGLITRASAWDFKEAWEIADGMIDAMDEKTTAGLPPIKRKRSK
jgi:hypothetical protein